MPTFSFDNFYYETFFDRVGFDINALLEDITADIDTLPLEVSGTFDVTFDTVFPGFEPTYTVVYLGTDDPAGTVTPGSIFFEGNDAIDGFINDLVDELEDPENADVIPVGFDPQGFIDAVNEDRTDDLGPPVDGSPAHFANTTYLITNLEESPGTSWPDINAVPYCFAAGTQIATPDGITKVECLRAGDLIQTTDGQAVPVKWIGRQTTHRLFTPEEYFRPVRIAAGALAENVPLTDLVVTPDHGILVGGVLANAGALVNGSTITLVPSAALPNEVIYYHVETENHDMIVANGTPAETFIDNVTREAFDNYGEYVELFGEASYEFAELEIPRAMSRRQLPAHVRALLADREAALASSISIAA